MYRHSNQSVGSGSSAGRRLSTNNPFRSALLQEEQGKDSHRSGSASPSVDDAQYKKWLNQRIVEEQDESRRQGYSSDDYEDYNDDDADSFTEGDESTHMVPPSSINRSKPENPRTSSDNSINRNSYNPFAPYNRSERSNSAHVPQRQRSEQNSHRRADFVAPPSYDEVVGKKYAKDEYPKDEKTPYTTEVNPFPSEPRRNSNTTPAPRRAQTVSSRRPGPPVPSNHTKPRLDPEGMTNTTTTRIMSDGRIRSKSTGEASPRISDDQRRHRTRDEYADSRQHRSQHRHHHHSEYERSHDRDRYYDRERDYDRDHRENREHRDYDRPRRSGTSRKKKPLQQERSKNVDTIDKLDVTGFFGGGKFHHDGPFDACTPQRNKDSKIAPVDAFPIDGPNNSIKGMAPGNSKEQQYDMVFGIDQSKNNYDGDYSKPRSKSVGYSNGAVIKRADSDLDSVVLNTKAPALEQVDAGQTSKLHGDTTLGLGSSTFMDGTPASGNVTSSSNSGGLQRKKTFLGRMKTIVRK
ncbi:hypothetical protein C6P40_001290 [Pichia californica]|uniref:Uncharacterized protein n=1 Tax=Pichia californica TaxID=460514 RepID=A0A9P6WJP7_9ASCO|nr:hypothetical protein C6P42_001351 [[Candida] californica]KAG0688197.1 hypothetical protein C6P40_001290 [[Candida] californica]